MSGERDIVMKMKKRLVRPYGLKARFLITLVVAGIFCIFVFFGLYFLSEAIITRFFRNSPFETIQIAKQEEHLQNYINRRRISSQNLWKLKRWEKHQPLILMEIYDGDDCIYSSFYENKKDVEGLYEGSHLPEERKNAVSVQLMDKNVTAFLYTDFSYQYYLLGTVIAFCLSMALFIFLFLRYNGILLQYIITLTEEVQILEGGNLDYQVTVQGNDEITDLARSMNRMKESFREQMEVEQKLYQANRRLVSEMSHDLRTPLTGIMLYLEILRSHKYQNEEQLQEYLEKIDAKAHHMKRLSDHLFEYTLDGRPDIKEEPVSVEKALAKLVQNMADELNANGFQTSLELEWNSCFIHPEKVSLQRIFENIVSNIIKYAEKGAEVRIETIYTDKYCGITVLNAYSPQEKEIESNSIGIDSIRTLMKDLGGICTVEQTDSVFEITILFPKQ